MSDEVDFLHAKKDTSLPQIDTMILMGMGQHSQSSQIASLQCLYNISKKEVRVEVFFFACGKISKFLTC